MYSRHSPIYLVRHGETVWNVEGRLQGWQDSPLTSRGMAQAHTAGRRLADSTTIRSPRVISSPLGRAISTANILLQALRPCRPRTSVEDGIAEHRFGDWEGLTWLEIERRWPGERANREADKWNFRVPGGESYALLLERLQEWLWSLEDDGPVIVVMHEMVSRVLRYTYAGLSTEEALRLPHPQDTVMVLADGKLSKL